MPTNDQAPTDPMIRVIENNRMEAERNRIADIRALGTAWERFGGTQLAEEFVRGNGSVEEFRGVLLERLSAVPNPPIKPTFLGGAPGRNGEVGLSETDRQRFSVRRAIMAACGLLDRGEAGFELEVSKATKQRLGRNVEGVLIPSEILLNPNPHRRDIAIGGGGTGGYLVQTDVLSGSFIEALRNKSAVLRAGAMPLEGLQGNAEIPKKLSGTTAYWVAEGSPVTESTPVFGQVGLTPKTVGGLVEYTRKFLLQSSLDAETICRDDLAEIIAIDVDRVAIKGAGSGEPSGILSLPSGIGNVNMGDNGGAPTWPKVVEFIADLGSANASGGRLGWITNAKVQAKMMTIEKATNTGLFLFEMDPKNQADGIIAGYPAYVTNSVPSNYTKGSHVTPDLSALIFGNWAELVIGQWGALELLSDPYTGFASGNVRVRALLDVDVAIRHAESFAISDEIITS